MSNAQADIAAEKLDQAVGLLEGEGLDAWITFARESSLTREPVLDLIYPMGVTWQSAFIVTRSGEKIAIVGRYDMENVERLKAYSTIIGYDESIRPDLIETVKRLNPTKIGINVSTNDPAADGLTAGMRLILEETLAEANIEAGQLVSAESFLGSLRGQKSSGELARIRRAIATTEGLFDEVEGRIRPGVSEIELADYLHGRLRELGLESAWDWNFDPIVNTGPDSVMGHAAPSELVVEPGHLVHLDFGVRQDGFSSDIQRMWYVLDEGEDAPPEEILNVWVGVRAALVAGAKAMKPGVQGWQVDGAARKAMIANGLPEYMHAYGHHVGRVAHDGATILGPRWDRYGDTPLGEIEVGNVFAIELGAKADEYGWVYLEENVLIGEDGLEWLSTPQESLRIIKPD